MRMLVTEAFKEKAGTTDVNVINRLIINGRMELEECLMLWKGPSHVRARTPRLVSLAAPSPLSLCPPTFLSRRCATQLANWFDNAETTLKNKKKPKADFLDSFFAG